MPSRPIVKLYERPDCHLCDEALVELEALRAGGLEFAIERVDIDGDEGLLRRYLEKIPVIELEGRVVSELGLDADGLRRRLATLSA
jgi:glutathione S-transferase